METSIISAEELRKMKDIDIRTVDKNQLVDLNSVVIDESRPVQERMVSFIQQIGNPYCFRVGDVAVKVVYKENGPTFQQNLEDMLMNLQMMIFSYDGLLPAKWQPRLLFTPRLITPLISLGPVPLWEQSPKW